jgi:hypothetical protein
MLAGAFCLPAQAQQDPLWIFEQGFMETTTKGDHKETLISGGFRVARRDGSIEFRADRAFILADRQELEALIEEGRSEKGLPTRGTVSPDARRRLTEEMLRQRLNSFLSAAGRAPDPAASEDAASEFPLRLAHTIYLEGNVVVVRDGTEVIRADTMFISLVDDRVVMTKVELRLQSLGSANKVRTITLRGERIVREGKRMHGRDISVTSSPEGRPAFEVFSGEVEVIERDQEFEIRSRGNSLVIEGVTVLPLPTTSFFSSDQAQIPIKSASGGYSGEEGGEGEIVLGGSLNSILSPLHESLTGRPGSEVRGDWELGLGYIRDRGYPIRPKVDYRADGLYRGETEYFALNDRGENIGDIRNRLDGSLIDDSNRYLLKSENRVYLGENTTLDLSLFNAGDPAVYSEFFRREYYTDERPETSARLRHAQKNFIATVGGRWNMADFSYLSSRELAPRFVEELPEFTADLFSQPIADLPGDTKLLLTSSTNVAQFRSDFDESVPRVDDETFRVDQELELSAPFRFAGMTLTPRTSARFTHYSDTAGNGDSRDRWSFSSGVTLGSRFSRAWRWRDAAGTSQAFRHVISPTVSFEHIFKVDGDPTDYNQFDLVDMLDERSNIRLGVLQRFQRRTGERGLGETRELLWLDLAQNFTPNSERDNDGHTLGLGEFELIARPGNDFLPMETEFVVEGEQDWNDDILRTFNTYMSFQMGARYFVGYRTDESVDGSIGYGVAGQIRDRWLVNFASQYDLEANESLNYDALLTRRDPNWNISLSLRYDNVRDETSISINFEPTFGGLFSSRAERMARGDTLFGTGNYTSY